jgi:DNA segregation ATPase FtsK/SpoIIIE, S-DNA-T family
MQRRELEAKADAIELVAATNQAPLQVTGGHVTPRWVQFLVQTNPGVKVSRVEALSREIATALGAPSARVTTQGNAIRIEVPRSDPQPLKLLPLCARIPPSRIPFGTAVLGLADDGAPLLIRLPSPEVAHVLVAGTTGSGKTALLQTIIMSLALLNHRRQIQFVLIDPKENSFTGLAQLPHLLRPILQHTPDIRDEISRLVTLCEEREQSRSTDPRIVIVIDDLEMVSHPDLGRLIEYLVRYGRAVGIHIIAATQKPSLIKQQYALANFPVRLVGCVVNAEDARVAAGVGGTGAEKLTGRGDFVAVYGPGLIRFQAAYIPSSEIGTVVQQLAHSIRGDEIIQSSRPTAARPAPRSSTSTSVLDGAVFALPGIDR